VTFKKIVLIYQLSIALPLESNPRIPYKAVLVLPLRQPGDKHNIVYSAIDQIREIKVIPEYKKKRVEIELVKRVCNIVENYV